MIKNTTFSKVGDGVDKILSGFTHSDHDEKPKEKPPMIIDEQMAEKIMKYGGFNEREILQAFDNYDCQCQEQRDAVECCKSLQKREWLVLLGPVGTGKDHLASATCRQIVMGGINTVFSGTAQAIMKKWRTLAYQGENANEWEAYEWFRKIGVLVIRDAGTKAFTDTEKATLIDILDARYGDFKTVIITGNMAASEFATVFDERVTDRMYEMGHKFKGEPYILCDWPSYRRK